MVGVPIFQLIILVNAATFDLKNTNLTVMDFDRSNNSRELVKRFSDSPFFTAVLSTNSEQEAYTAIEKGRADAILTIPRNFERDIAVNHKASVMVEINAINASAAGLINSYSNTIISNFNQDQLLPGQKVTMVVVNHQSNVNGLVQPIAEIKKAIGDIPILVDASQSAGGIPIDCNQYGIDYLAFTGHKGLLGPTGIGGFYTREPESIEPLIFGGTGSNSSSYDMPTSLPDKFQAGTPNMIGAAGLLGALLANITVQHSRSNFVEMLQHLNSIQGLELFCATEIEHQGETFSFRYTNENPGNTAFRLYQLFGIETRSGLHCAPLAHGSNIELCYQRT